MATTKIRGITIQLGGDASGLSKALKEVNSEISKTQKDLKDVDRLLKLDPKNTELLAQKQRLLGDAVGETKRKLDSLKDAEREVQAQFAKGEGNQRQYDALQREIAATEISLESLERQARETGTALSGLSTISAGAGKLSSAMAPVTAGIVGLGTAAYAAVPATEELRTDLSKLDQNALESGVAIDKAREAYRAFAIQSGETDSAIEGVSNLLQAGFTESNLQKAVEGLAGAAQRFPDTLKIEGLADGLQETLATGKAMGQFGELLDRVGVGAETFEAQLAACTTEAQRQDLVLQTLASAGLNDSYNAWAKNNEELIANKDASLRFEEAMAGLAETILPVVTLVTDKLADLINWFTSLDEGVQNTILVVLALVAAISPVAGIISTVTGALGSLSGAASMFSLAGGGLSSTVLPAIGKALAALTSPVGLVVTAIVGLIALIATFGDEIQAKLQEVDDFLQGVFATDWTEVFGPVLGGILNNFLDNVKAIWDGVKQIFDGIIDFIRGVFTLDWERAWTGVKEIFGGIFDTLAGLVKSPINSIISLLNGAISAVNSLISGFNSIHIDIPDWLGGGSWNPSLPTIPSIPMLARGGTLRAGSAIVGEAGPELLTLVGGAAQVTPLTNNTTHNTALGGITINLYGNFESRSSAEDYGHILGVRVAQELRGMGVTV